jgi:excisionase family DNA binding protein
LENNNNCDNNNCRYMHEEKQYITLQEAAALLGIAVITFRKLVREGVITPEFKLGMNFPFSREKVKALKPEDLIIIRKFRNHKTAKYRLKPPTPEELALLKKDTRNELDKTQYAKEQWMTRQRLLLKIYSIGYRKMYFDRFKGTAQVANAAGARKGGT